MTLSEDNVGDKKMRPFSEQTTKKLLSWYQKQPEIERKECHVLQRQQVNVIMNGARKRGEKIEDNGEVYYRAFLWGIDKRMRLRENRRLKSTDDLEEVTKQRIAVEKAKAKAKPSPILDRLHGDLLPVVIQLKKEGLSWQKVSNYLREYHQLEVDRRYLHKVFSGHPDIPKGA
jgi:hypothetical protein